MLAQAIVISDEEADKAAACLNVGVGAMSDPRSGTAHFLEHVSAMLWCMR